ncbi:histidine kinase dimerization/phospho-acceptor domain-containing protein [Christensenella hongkongensis]|nr:histidine kinase dimerization/phospho-acceptor domain-containing protein [Christensenella hongkongensis]
MSLRMRLTLFTILLLTCVAIVFTLSSMYNANLSFVVPYITYSAAIKDQDLPVPPDGQSQEALPEAAISSSTSTEASFPGGAYQPPDESTMDFDQSVSMITASASRFNNTSLFIMLGVIAGGGLLTYFLLGRALAPVRELSKEIQGITENELSERVAESDRNDEIGQLARSFNTMLERLDKAFSDQKRFSSDAAHELKTPLAAIKTNIDVLQLDDDPTSSEYKETIEVVKKQTGRMIRLVDDLFTMSAQRDYDFNDTIFFDDMFHDIISQLKPRIVEKTCPLI